MRMRKREFKIFNYVPIDGVYAIKAFMTFLAIL